MWARRGASVALVCAALLPTAASKSDPCLHPECVFPFTYYGVTYNTCTSIGEGGKGEWEYTWCSTEADFEVGSGNYRKVRA